MNKNIFDFSLQRDDVQSPDTLLLYHMPILDFRISPKPLFTDFLETRLKCLTVTLVTLVTLP